MATTWSLSILNDVVDPTLPSTSYRTVFSRALTQLVKLEAGNHAGPAVSLQFRGAATQAAGTLTLTTASGTVGGVINGVTVTATAAGGDTASAALIAAAINASVDPLVQNIVKATSSGAVVTVTAVQPGLTGNAVTLVASGSGVAASGARLTGGTETLSTYAL